MDSDVGQPRLGAAAAIASFLDTSFLLLPPTVNFPYAVVAHGDLGMAALIVHDSVVLLDAATGKWLGPGETIDPETMAAEAALELAAAARAPADRVTALVWLPQGLVGPDGVTIEQIVASPDPEAAAKAIQDLMVRRLSGSNEPTAPWAGAYAASAMGATGRPSQPLRRLLAATEFSLAKALADAPIVCFGHEMTIADLVDPHYLLPALAIAAAEDWRMPTRRKTNGTGFRISLEPDPATLLGYRLTDIRPAIPFTALAPIVSTAMRSKEGDEYCLDDLVGQFGRWLKKNNMDAAVLDDVEERVATSA